MPPEASETVYVATANVSFLEPASFAAPAGGLRVRFRAPTAHAGKMVSVTVGGKAWAAFDPIAETVDFTANELQSSTFRAHGLSNVVATFAAPAAAS
jgi:hypothetical protein